MSVGDLTFPSGAVPFPSMRFQGTLRPSQQDVVDIARTKLDRGHRRLHIVAPPGSGKTVLGLFLWAECVKRPAVVLSPNSAIQAQWAARTDLFQIEDTLDEVVSTDPTDPALLTSLTYQSLTMPAGPGEELDARAVEFWIEKLVESGQAQDPREAEVWIADLAEHNPSYHGERLAIYRKQIRDDAAAKESILKQLHDSSLATLSRLRDRDVGMIILDECHHLMGHWGRVLAGVQKYLGDPVIVGLTATPPDREGRKTDDVERYDEFFGPIDFEVPVPAVIKDGYLAPYQDLAYIVRPTPEELKFIEGTDEQFRAVMNRLCEPRVGAAPLSVVATVDQSDLPDAAPVNGQAAEPAPPARIESLVDWVCRVLAERRLPTATFNSWKAFEKRDPDFCQAGRKFLRLHGRELPADVPPLDDAEPGAEPTTDAASALDMEMLIPVIDRYVRHGLRRSRHPDDQRDAERAVQQLRLLGVQITETGHQGCASPVGRVLAYSRNKMSALVPILQAEHAHLGDGLRAIVVCDYEKTSAVSADVAHLLDDEAGGAVAAFKTLLADPATDVLDPVLVTGSSVLVDDDLVTKFGEFAQLWLRQEGFKVDLTSAKQSGFHVINGSGADWCPRVYVALVTEMFQRGLTKCLIGTRGLLGEGWDATKVNVLVDLTTATTAMTVNQLRGRSIRLDADQPRKLANNWDVVCVAPEFTKGLDDYQRFIKKHATIFGVTEDGAIEKGVGHVYAGFTEIEPELLEGSAASINAGMLSRVGRRDEFRELWKIGQPYHPDPIRTVEFRPLANREAGTYPPFRGARSPWTAEALARAASEAVLGALVEASLVPSGGDIQVTTRNGGYVRVFLMPADEDVSRVFAEAVAELFSPLDRPRYVIPRNVHRRTETLLSRVLPGFVGRYFHKDRKETVMLHAVPSVLAKNREQVDIFQKYWNAHVGPGEPSYVQRGEGERVVERARKRGILPQTKAHVKEVFL